MTEGCLQRICKAGVWRTSLANNICCYEKTAYTINTTISSSMSEDGCARAAIDCVEETPGIAKTMLSLENFCKKYATKDQVEEIRNLLVNQIAGAGPGCQGDIEGGKDKAEKEEEEGILFVYIKAFSKPVKQKVQYFPSCSLPVVQLDIAASFL